MVCLDASGLQGFGGGAAVVATRALVDAGFSTTVHIQLEPEAQHQSTRFADPAVAASVEQFSGRTKAQS